MAQEKIVNGVDVQALGSAIHQFRHAPELCDFKFRATTKWIDGGHSQTTIEEFYGAGQEQDGRSFSLKADEPGVLLGQDRVSRSTLFDGPASELLDGCRSRSRSRAL